ncbi:MAG: bifunctional shikimate kinase/3-dehydroquinate synthase [Solirubrobacterales bacterium]
MSRPAIVFIGFMGAGKSTALAAARKAGLETTEIDELMERELGMPIAEAFEREGEEAFRAREAEVVGKLLDEADGGAIALGGGSVLSERVRDALARHVVVWLQIDAEEAWRRIEGTDRPLARSAGDVAELLAVRLPLYEALADAVVPPGDHNQIARALPSIQALAELPRGTKLLWAASASGEYPVVVGRELLSELDEERWSTQPGRPFLVGDTFTLEQVRDWLLESFLGTVVLIGHPISGEESKTMDDAKAILEAMAESGMTREDYVLALGGGVVGDIAGFCAHIYQRGVPVVQVPTTLLAQIDSAYGGKTGVDLPQGKNYVGAYHLPAAVIADVDTLGSLPKEELAAGFAEALKTGLLAGGRLWERVRAIESLDPSDLDDVVFDCARYKCGIVAEDERDSGRREVLNLGHTVGHAIEAASEYSRYRHGEAIGLGLLAALRLSDLPELHTEVEGILIRHDLSVTLDPSIEIEPILDALQRDKKRTAEGVGFVLLSEPGKPRTGQVLDSDAIEAAVVELYG